AGRRGLTRQLPGVAARLLPVALRGLVQRRLLRGSETGGGSLPGRAALLRVVASGGAGRLVGRLGRL
ncbi:hypothetical protein CRI70_14670, partial [Streptomyces sp. Ru87]